MHGRPESGWLNDPNGLAHVDGVWHVFFQHNPDGPQHGDIRWGHVSSADLVTWRAEPVALAPVPGGPDSAGCWTGCVVLDGPDAVPTAVYTGVGAGGPGRAVTLVATSDRTLRRWQQEPEAVTLPPTDPAVSEVRDPFVFEHDGHRYAVLGAGHPDGSPQLLLHGCDDLRAWTPLGPLLTHEDPVAARVAGANIWECPNLVRVGDDWLLVFSLWHRDGDTHRLDGVVHLVGDLVAEGPGLRFVARSGGPVDGGRTFYAPQVLAADGRALLWAWSREDDRDPAEVEASGWSGVLTFPRELSLAGGTLRVEPAAELLALRREELGTGETRETRERSFEVVADGPAALLLAQDGGEPRLVATFGSSGHARALVDGSIVEVFEDGAARTLRAYPRRGAVWHVRGAGRTHRLGEPAQEG
nr:glycoside hydrolase family 32 protein [Kineococcus aurantiacus]